MKLRCIKDVIMSTDPQYKAFTEGQEYKGYKTRLKHEWSYIRVIRAKNDHKEAHIIKHLDDNSLDNFYELHFEEIKK